MINMVELFRNYTSDFSNPVFNSVVEGMSPFRIAEVRLWDEFDIDFNRYLLAAEVETLSGYRFGRHVVLVEREDLLDDSHAEMRRVAAEMRDAFRYRLTWPVNDNIVLGEN